MTAVALARAGRKRAPEPEHCRHEWDGRYFPPWCRRCGKRAHASPSQAEHWEGCQRKWAYSRSPDFERETSAAAEFGDEVHAIREDYLNFGTSPDLTTKHGRCAVQGLERLPMPGTCLVEQRANMFIDLRGERVAQGGEGIVEYQPRLDVVCNYVPGLGVEVLDHKTTGDRKWIKTPEILADDVQRIVYAEWGATEYRVPWVAAHWEYLLRDATHDRPVWLVEDAATIHRRFVDVHTRVIVPMVAANGRPIDSFERNLSYCGKYGRCPYTAHCHRGVSPIDIAAAMLYNVKARPYTADEESKMTEPTQDLYSGLLAQAQAGMPSATPPVAPLSVPASALPAGFPGYVQAAPVFGPDVEAWIAAHPPELQGAKRAEALAAGHPQIVPPTAPTMPAAAPAIAPMPAAPSMPQPTAPTYTPTIPQAPGVVPPQAPTGGPVVRPNTPGAPVPTTAAPAAAREKRERGRPPVPASVKMLESCAAGGQTREQAEWYLAKLGELEGGGQ